MKWTAIVCGTREKFTVEADTHREAVIKAQDKRRGPIWSVVRFGICPDCGGDCDAILAAATEALLRSKKITKVEAL